MGEDGSHEGPRRRRNEELGFKSLLLPPPPPRLEEIPEKTWIIREQREK